MTRECTFFFSCFILDFNPNDLSLTVIPFSLFFFFFLERRDEWLGPRRQGNNSFLFPICIDKHTLGYFDFTLFYCVWLRITRSVENNWSTFVLTLSHNLTLNCHCNFVTNPNLKKTISRISMYRLLQSKMNLTIFIGFTRNVGISFEINY